MARDPDRIDDILEQLEDYWEDHPDLRLGQIVSNIAQKEGVDDPFFIEDEELLEGLKDKNR